MSLLVGDVLITCAERAPRRTAVALGEQQLSFGQLAERAERLAAGLLARGIARGSRVVWLAETSLDAVTLYFATALVGAVFIPLNPRLSDAELSPILALCKPQLVLGDSRSGVDCGIDDVLARAGGGTRFPEVHEDDVHVVFFTSGSTGEPKGCMLSHRTERLRAGPGSKWPLGATVCMFPFFHMAGWSFNLPAWLSGDAVVFVPRADAQPLLEAVTRHRAHRMYCIPAVWRRILDADRSGYDLSSLAEAMTGTSYTSPQLLGDIAAACPRALISVSYGSTETTTMCMLGPEDIVDKAGSVGRPCPGVRVRVDETGELWARTPFVFSGYLGNEQATRTALVDGWYRTGDLAVRDDDGFYHIVGRAKDLIRTGGETVSPVEVDAVLQSHPQLADAAVVGVPDESWGEIIAAFIVARGDGGGSGDSGGSPIGLEEIRIFLKTKLAPHKWPRALFVVEDIPRTASTGQVRREHLRSLAEQRGVLREALKLP